LLPDQGLRIRDVLQASDGSITLLTDSAQGQVLQLQALPSTQAQPTAR
jgi:glucose/arabinose dehydrogenase